MLAWLEKHDIRRLIIATQILTLLHALIMALLIFTDTIQMWHILFLSFYLGVVFAVDMPARQVYFTLKNMLIHCIIIYQQIISNKIM